MPNSRTFPNIKLVALALCLTISQSVPTPASAQIRNWEVKILPASDPQIDTKLPQGQQDSAILGQQLNQVLGERLGMAGTVSRNPVTNKLPEINLYDLEKATQQELKQDIGQAQPIVENDSAIMDRLTLQLREKTQQNEALLKEIQARIKDGEEEYKKGLVFKNRGGLDPEGGKLNLRGMGGKEERRMQKAVERVLEAGQR